MTVESFSHVNANHQSIWRVRCACGTVRTIVGSELRRATYCGRHCPLGVAGRAEKLRVKTSAFWATQSPEQRHARASKSAANRGPVKRRSPRPPMPPERREQARQNLARVWRENPPPHGCAANPNRRLPPAAAEYAMLNRARMTSREIARRLEQPQGRIGAVIQGDTWVGLDIPPLPPLPFPDTAQGVPVRPVPGYEKSHAVSRDGRVFSFPLAADQEHRAYSEPRELRQFCGTRSSGLVHLCLAGRRKRMVTSGKIAAEAWRAPGPNATR